MTNSAKHPDSWYAATRNLDVNYPALSEEITTNVCVVGAGFSGLATALYLAEQGTKVTLLEASKIGWGASGRNGGQLVCGYGEGTETLVTKTVGVEAGKRARQLGLECNTLVKDVIERYKIECDLTWGYLRLAMTSSQERDLRGMYADWDKRDFPGEKKFIEKPEMADYIGSSKYCAGVYNDHDGHVHPLNLAIGEAKVLNDLGVQIFEETPALSITDATSTTKARITTPGGVINADTVVLCGNAYLDKVEPRIRWGLIPGYSCMIATEPLSEETAKRLIPHNTAVSDMRTVLDYYRLSPDNRMLWGGLGHWSGNNTDNPEPLLYARMIKIFPELKGTKVDFRWSGRIGISSNLNPQIGRLAPSTYYVQAYSGHGVAPCHLSGKMISEAILHGSEDFEMFAKLKPIKVPPIALIQQAARAWGMNSRRVVEWF
jgi:gamma-glutamylputrescine oxidase